MPTAMGSVPNGHTELSAVDTTADQITVIERQAAWRVVDWREFAEFKDLFRFLIWRQIKVRYAQSAIGVGWAIIQPLFSMIVFSVVFGALAGMRSDGAPYALFSFAALIPWVFFSNAVTDGVGSLVNEANLLSKVYFPRLLLPLSALATKLVDFAIAMVVMGVLLVAYGHTPGRQLAVLPLLICLMIMAAAGVSIWCAALAVQYRDVKHATGFAMQLGMYASPIVYPTSLIPEKYHFLYAINPMVGVIEGFRSALLSTQPVPWLLIGIGLLSSAAVFVSGLAVFRMRERTFADFA